MAGEVRLEPDATSSTASSSLPGARRQPAGPDDVSGRAQTAGFQPWQLFVLAALAVAIAGIFLTRAEGVSGVVLLTVLIGAAALVGLGALKTVQPLVTDVEDRTRVIGQRTREALEREKTLALRALKELEFDRAMGKLADADFQDMSTRLRARATRLLRQLDSAEGYRSRIEQDLAQRLSKEAAVDGTGAKAAAVGRSCAACATSNDTDARFCKECGAKL